MTAYAIRPFDDGDVPRIVEIYADAVLNGTASFEVDPPDAAEMRRRAQFLRDAGYPYLVAAEGAHVLGYAYAGPYRTRPGYRNTVEDSVYIAPAARRRGVGRSLLEALIAESESLGFRRMIAVIGDSAQAPSIALHEACGFTVAGTLPAVGWKAGRWLDSVLMQRPLGLGADAPPER